ncbi:hypothetical protein Q4508_00695 [Amphritea sp. 2_MG-2023]|uniref:hypothetical protein n=1 Tax=Amphritea TaxID=515417 RepID=UPI001C0767E7|nr:MULTISPECIES: hypothetical protein [Amphritea]MBU2966227.1 hypothetical protein [Amphritea atlantica]MDO6417071.1 hypothetical protein [Amphritea sp. 2_MG-2023]MDX2423747.1 hypothetical protein [Amphritea sp.]
MCSSPKASHHSHSSGTTLRPTQLSGHQQADFAAKANAAFERREQRRLQRNQTAPAPMAKPSLLQQFWHKLFRADTTPPTTQSHSTQ